jgi:hypothetical protein
VPVSLRYTIPLVALLCSPSHAHAQVNISWHQCTGLPHAAANLNYACDGSANGTPFRAVLSFVSPATMSQFVGMQARLDMDTHDAVLPDFWRLGVGECREGNFSFPAWSGGIGNTTTCLNPWTGAMTGGGFLWTSANLNAMRARCLFAFARDSEGALTQGVHYVAGVFSLDTLGDAGTDVCVGCEVPACLVLNVIELYQTSGAPPQDIYYLDVVAQRQGITWQGGPVNWYGLCPALVDPVKNRTWGSVKATYR